MVKVYEQLCRIEALVAGVFLVLMVVLIFVGVKMTLSHWVHLPTLVSLAFIVVTLAAAILLSLRRSAREERQAA